MILRSMLQAPKNGKDRGDFFGPKFGYFARVTEASVHPNKKPSSLTDSSASEEGGKKNQK